MQETSKVRYQSTLLYIHSHVHTPVFNTTVQIISVGDFYGWRHRNCKVQQLLCSPICLDRIFHHPPEIQWTLIDSVKNCELHILISRCQRIKYKILAKEANCRFPHGNIKEPQNRNCTSFLPSQLLKSPMKQTNLW